MATGAAGAAPENELGFADITANGGACQSKFVIICGGAEGDGVVVRWTLTGTHLGEYDGVAPTNKAVKSTGITIYHFADGKIVDDRYESSGLSLHDQLLGA